MEQQLQQITRQLVELLLQMHHFRSKAHLDTDVLFQRVNFRLKTSDR